VKRLRAMVKQKSHVLMDGLAADELVVIQHQSHLPIGNIEVIDEAGQDRFRQRLERRRRELRGLAPDCGVSLAQSGDQIAQEAPRLIVIFVERQPYHRHTAPCEARGDQSRFAKTGGGGDQGQRAA